MTTDLELTKKVSNAISNDPLLNAVRDFAQAQIVVNEWKRRGADERDPQSFRDIALQPLEEAAQRVDKLLGKEAA